MALAARTNQTGEKKRREFGKNFCLCGKIAPKHLVDVGASDTCSLQTTVAALRVHAPGAAATETGERRGRRQHPAYRRGLELISFNIPADAFRRRVCGECQTAAAHADPALGALAPAPRKLEPPHPLPPSHPSLEQYQRRLQQRLVVGQHQLQLHLNIVAAASSSGAAALQRLEAQAAMHQRAAAVQRSPQKDGGSLTNAKLQRCEEARASGAEPVFNPAQQWGLAAVGVGGGELSGGASCGVAAEAARKVDNSVPYPPFQDQRKAPWAQAVPPAPAASVGAPSVEVRAHSHPTLAPCRRTGGAPHTAAARLGWRPPLGRCHEHDACADARGCCVCHPGAARHCHLRRRAEH